MPCSDTARNGARDFQFTKGRAYVALLLAVQKTHTTKKCDLVLNLPINENMAISEFHMEVKYAVLRLQKEYLRERHVVLRTAEKHLGMEFQL
jgi:hypothetical protein